ncbi:hypothetical protein WHZ77_04135 [Bradyrhizobium sp. A5]|uniref:hypothetical protein n=1 Tax=Bradyrhizobium sp. A5 TaxID=3133696 RepID=UPI003243AD35
MRWAPALRRTAALDDAAHRQGSAALRPGHDSGFQLQPLRKRRCPATRCDGFIISREPRTCELDHLSAQPWFVSLSAYYQTDDLLGIEHMKQFIALFVAAIALVVLPTIAAADCPKGYVPCGEKNQLCCPGK